MLQLILTWTSSSFLMGMDRTPYLALSSLDRGADINFLRMWEGAEKCLFLCFLLEEVTNLFNFIVIDRSSQSVSQGGASGRQETAMPVLDRFEKRRPRSLLIKDWGDCRRRMLRHAGLDSGTTGWCKKGSRYGSGQDRQGWTRYSGISRMIHSAKKIQA